MTPADVVLLLGCVLPCAAWAGHTTASKALAEDIDRARRMCGMSQKELAIELGVTEQKLSRQLAGTEPLNAWRLYGLTNPEFRVELLSQQINRVADAGVTVVTNAHLGTLISRLDFLLGQTTKPILKATLGNLQQKREAS